MQAVTSRGVVIRTPGLRDDGLLGPDDAGSIDLCRFPASEGFTDVANFFFGERGEGDEIGRAGLAPLLRGVVLVGLTPSCRIEHDQNQHD